ncbi:hypothetical protein GCM10023156_57580 [Novipirellula rosea]|uniref:Uncharacterized protein n=2 Tax=Novipirellula rosea TaxID=1031540 RepID=A0ABP8NLC1_9BACT
MYIMRIEAKVKSKHRRGATLLDVVTGSMLLSVLLIPSLHLVTRSQKMNRRLKLHDSMLYEADQLLQQRKILLSDQVSFTKAWARPMSSPERSTIVTEDGHKLAAGVLVQRNTTIKSSKLLTITCQVWQDRNRNGRVDEDEPVEELQSHWGEP